MHQTHVAGGLVLLSLGASGCASPGRTFPSPEDAIKAVADVAGTGDRKQIDEIFGAGATEVIWSGDPAADRANGLLAKEMILTRVEFEQRGDDLVASVGSENWPFPIPLVHVKGGWRFDLAAGKEELLNRRIGRNELHTIETLQAFVDAQRDYAAVGRDSNPPAYAFLLHSTEGMHDGLYWPVAEGEPESPLGPLLASAAEEGYHRSADVTPQPFHGYYYRILTAQGPAAPGGARDYVDRRGLMTGGFAAVAWPATWGNSGVMTFVVNQIGVVFQKDLGPDTETAVVPITSFNPDETWEPASD